MKKNISIFALLLFCCVNYNLIAQEQTIWTLEACIRQAQEKNIGIKQANIGVKSAENTYKMSRQAALPNLNFSTSLNWNFGKSIDPTTNSFITQNFLSNNGGLFSEITLYQGGALSKDRKSKHYNTLSSKATLEQQKRDIALQVALVYLQILYQKDQIAIAENQFEIGKLQKERIERLIDVGNVPASDLYEIDAQLANSDQILILAKNNYDKNILFLQQLIHLEASESEGFQIDVPEIELSKNMLSTDITYEQLLESSLEREPAIAAKKWDVKSTQYNVEIAQSSYLPSLNLSGNLGAGYSELAKNPNINLEWQERAPTRINGVEQNVEFLSPVIAGYENIPYFEQLDQNIRYGASLSLSIPIYNRGRVSNGVQQAKLQNESAQLALENATYKLKTDVSNALFDFKSSAKIWMAKTRTLDAKKLSFDQSKKLFELGNISIFDYTMSKSSFENAEHEALNAKYDLLFKRKILDYYMGEKLSFK